MPTNLLIVETILAVSKIMTNLASSKEQNKTHELEFKGWKWRTLT